MDNILPQRMGDTKENTGGLLKGLKRLIFSDVEETIAPAPPQKPASQITPSQVHVPASNSVDPEAKLKVYQVLEGMNRPGCDFFEVWNASVEMGGANVTNLKSAYTSLKFADATLSKAKLEETGNYYIAELSKVLSLESQKRKAEIDSLEIKKSNSKASLSQEIEALEIQIKNLQDKLDKKKLELENIQSNYDPQIEAIRQRIVQGESSVNDVISEMRAVLDIISKEIN